jgi:tyrosinase
LHTRPTVTFASSSVAQHLKSSSNTSDPIFFLHHGQLDRTWAAWQAHDPRNRNTIAGFVVPDPDNFDAHPLGTGMPVTGDTTIYMAGVGPDAKIHDVLSTTGGYLCYQYAT